VVEDCVNAVGVDVNMASAALLTRISGLNPTLAANIVAHRDANGPFPSRAALLEVPRLGPKTFEQAAGFLRVTNGTTRSTPRPCTGSLPGGRTHPRRHQEGRARSGRQPRHRPAQARATPTNASACPPCRTS
jgi:transcriptional accessory protein Tex/SPT6